MRRLKTIGLASGFGMLLMCACVAGTRETNAFEGDWRRPLIGPSAWQWLHAMEDDRITRDFEQDGPNGRGVVRVEVRQGDKVGGWSGERSEVANMLNDKGDPIQETPFPDTVYYAFAIRLDPDWQNPTPDPRGYRWGTILQLHGPDSLGVPPAFALFVEGEYGVSVQGGDVSVNRAPKRYRLPGGLNRGSWTRFIVGVRWSPEKTGSVEVWRGMGNVLGFVKQVDLRGIATLQYENEQPTAPHYWKFGYYRSDSPFTSRLWLTPLVRADSFEKAKVIAFGSE
jgi:hypothetical protein